MRARWQGLRDMRFGAGKYGPRVSPYAGVNRIRFGGSRHQPPLSRSSVAPRRTSRKLGCCEAGSSGS